MENWWIFALTMILVGALRVFLRERGWWFDWEKIDREKQQEKTLLRAYKKWRKDAGPEAAADLSVTLDRFADGASDSRTVENSTR